MIADGVCALDPLPRNKLRPQSRRAEATQTETVLLILFVSSPIKTVGRFSWLKVALILGGSIILGKVSLRRVCVAALHRLPYLTGTRIILQDLEVSQLRWGMTQMNR